MGTPCDAFMIKDDQRYSLLKAHKNNFYFNPYTAIPHKYLCANIPDWQRAIPHRYLCGLL